MQTPKEIKLSDILDEIARGSHLDQALHMIAQKATVDLKAQASKIWVVKHGDICERCPLAGICTNRQMCLHLAAAGGGVMEREYPRIPLSVLNTSLIVRGGVSDFTDNNGAGEKLFGLQKSAYTTGTTSYALYPLKGISGTVGMIGVFNDRMIDQDELQILAQLSPAAVAAIRVAELLARCDSLRYQLEKSAGAEADADRLLDLRETNQQLQDQLNRLNAERESRRAKTREETEAWQEMERRAAALRAENEALKERLESRAAPGYEEASFVEPGPPPKEANDLNGARQILESQISLLEETNEELRDYNTSLVETVENLELSLRQAEDERGKLEETLAQHREASERLRAEQTRAADEQGQLAYENDRRREEVPQLHKLTDDIKREAAPTGRAQNSPQDAARLDELEQENARLREANAQLTEAVEQFESLIPRLEEGMTNLRSRMELSERLCAEMEQRNRALSEEKRQLTRRERAESRLLASLAHELRTPMNSILGFTSLLLDDASLPLGERHRHNLDRIARNARDMGEFLNQVLNFSKIEAGRMDVYAEPLQVQDVVARAVGVAEGLKGDRVALRTEFAEDLPIVCTDRIKLQQILLNLLSNAAKFTDQGTITVAVARAGPDQVRLSVSDTGIGIAEHELPTIFEEFRQVAGRRANAKSGVGLGLAITRRLVTLLGGEITVSSKPGEGTVFVVTLPQAIESREAMASGYEGQELDPARTALVIGSDPAMLYLTRKYLSEAGYSVATTEEAGRGLELVRLASPSVIIADLDATEAVSDLVNQLASRKEGGRLIACALDANQERRARQAGADFFLRKPVEREHLLATLEARAVTKSRPYILIVDDNADTLEIVKEMVGSLDYDVRTATDGREALAEVAQNRPSAIILDLMLPEMDGFEVTHRLRLNPAWREIPVILLTARDLSNEERNALTHGPTRLLQKGSFSRDDLLEELHRATNGV